ncbi:hypothetical protein B0T17DRAFT_545453, partial [Bombardia bombarda]
MSCIISVLLSLWVVRRNKLSTTVPPCERANSQPRRATRIGETQIPLQPKAPPAPYRPSRRVFLALSGTSHTHCTSMCKVPSLCISSQCRK